MRKARAGVILGVACMVIAGVAPVRAQFQMPDPRQMSGIPRPVDDLPSGSISVRLIRGSLSNNITNHPVELHIGPKIISVKTDENGRAQFDKVPAGATVQATSDVDGEKLQSQQFEAPSQGGIRLMLVATDKSQASASKAAPGNAAVPAVDGQVVIGTQSRIVLEPSDETVNVFYLLEISNTARAPVNPQIPFVFDVPKEAIGTALMEGSSPRASVSGGRVRVQGPFAPGGTFVQVAFALPSASGSVDFTQAFPATTESFAVVAKKLGDMTLSSPEISTQREMPAEGELFIAGAGGAVSAGQPIHLSLSALPHHSSAPRVITLTLASAIVLVAVWVGGGASGAKSAKAVERKRLLAKREKLLNDLVRLESDRARLRGAAADERRYAARRGELVSALEEVYGALDSDDSDDTDDHTRGPGPVDRDGLAA